MDVTKERIIVKQHEIIVSVGETGHSVKLLIRTQGKKLFSAIVTEHILPNGEECGHIPNLPVMNSSLEVTVNVAVVEHFRKHHPEEKRSHLSVVKK